MDWIMGNSLTFRALIIGLRVQQLVFQTGRFSGYGLDIGLACLAGGIRRDWIGEKIS
jgi:hypothetical protein